MGLADVIQKAAKTAFKVIGNIPLICSYSSKGTATYVPAKGAYISAEINYAGLAILFEDYVAEEITAAGGVILATDQKASIPNLNLTPTPKIKDVITDSNNKKWTIENVGIDPARALWIFQVRKSN